MRTINTEIFVCCPHCEYEDLYDINATTCVENTCMSWKVIDGENEVKCSDCGAKFKVTAHLDAYVEEI